VYFRIVIAVQYVLAVAARMSRVPGIRDRPAT
jgi:hypothetical protein